MGLAARERLAFRAGNLALSFVETAWAEFKPEEARRIDGPRHLEFAWRHQRKADSAEETFGANEHNAAAAARAPQGRGLSPARGEHGRAARA